MRRSYVKRWGRPATTLLEVLAAMAIMAGAGVAMLLTQAASIERLRVARIQTTARYLAKELIAGWQIDQYSSMGSKTGEFVRRQGWSWRREIRVTEVLGRGELQLVVLHLNYANSAVPGGDWTTTLEWLARNEDERKQ